jgi:hypothetical protein
MLSLLQRAREHAFVASVSIAAFTHSSWSLATVFSGHEPQFGLSWVGWIVPAALIAASIDIGLLSLAAQIKHRDQRTWGRVLSFTLLCAGMFALQGLYVASHMPVIELGPGVRQAWLPAASLFRDSMLIVVPGLLPLALILHTISGAEAVSGAGPQAVSGAEPQVVAALADNVTAATETEVVALTATRPLAPTEPQATSLTEPQATSLARRHNRQVANAHDNGHRR